MNPAPGRRARVTGHTAIELTEGWEAAAGSAPGPEPPAVDWLPARVPGTAAAALAAAGIAADDRDLDAEDWWFRTTFDAEPAADGEEIALRLDGIATVADVFLNGEPLLETGSMFARHEADVGGRLRGSNELAIRCRALAPLLAERRRPRARWRTRVVAQQNLRFFRTAILGRAPGFAPEPGAGRPMAARRARAPRGRWWPTSFACARDSRATTASSGDRRAPAGRSTAASRPRSRSS